jgi:adenylate cyclase
MVPRLKQVLWGWRGVLLAVPVVTGVVIALRLAGFLQLLELAILDQLFQLRPQEPVDSRIVIVTINESDKRQLKSHAIPDYALAQALRAIKQQQPIAIGLDIYRDLPVGTGSEELLQVFKTTPNLIGVQKVGNSSDSAAVAAHPILKQQDQIGSNDFVLDSDGKIRRGLIYLDDPLDKNVFVFNFGYRLAYRYLARRGIQDRETEDKQVAFGQVIFPRLGHDDGGYVRAEDTGYQILINYRGGTQSFPQISFSDVFNGGVPANFMRDRIVLIGDISESGKDLFYTPYSSGVYREIARMPGVVIHANMISQILSSVLDDRHLIRTWPEWAEDLWFLVWASIGGVICWHQRFRTGGTGVLLLKRSKLIIAGTCLLGTTYTAFLFGWWIPVLPPMLGLAGAAISIVGYMAHSGAEARKTFGRYLTDAVVFNLLETPGALKLGGERRKVTVLMSDLRGFSAVSEWLPPEKVVTLLNLYLGAMADVVDQYKGTINEFIGDGIFIMFGAPMDRPDDSQRAIACAIAMQLAMASVNEQNKQLGLPPIEMGIGINTGEVVVGNIGSQKRAKYTVIGSHVNLTARIESYTVGGQILISEDTLKDAQCDVKITGEMRVEPKGIKAPITLYEVGGIGNHYNLFLPESDETMVAPAQKVLLEYTVLEGKHAVGNLFKGQICKLSSTSAEIGTDHELDLLSNLKLRLLIGSEQIQPEQAQPSAEMYAKVIKKVSDRPHHFLIRFTSFPPEIAPLLQSLQEQQP